MKKILIFGATGNTGAYLVDYFIQNIDKREYEIIAIGRRETSFFKNNNIPYFQVDISDAKQIHLLPIENVHAVVLAAAKLPTHEAIIPPIEFINTNIIGVLNVLEYCKKNKIDRVLFTQTMSNIALSIGNVEVLKPNLPKNFPYKGDHAMYVISKNTAEELVEHYHQEYGLKKFIFHIPTIYQFRKNRYWYVDGVKKFRTFHHLIDLAISGEPIEMWGDEKSYKDMVYVKDYCQMLFKATFVNLESGYYNVGTGLPVTLKEMIYGIVDVFSKENKRSKIIHLPEKPNTPSYIIDIENAREELKYEPKYNYIQMLKDIKFEMEADRFKDL